MADIRHRVGIAASRARVYESLATKEGLSQWWTHDVEGDAHVGGTLRFYFAGPEPSAERDLACQVMEVVALDLNHRVEWRCVQGADEWVGTNLIFDLKSADGETVLLFTHANWREPVEFMYHCSTKWAYFLLGLKAGLEGGKATTYPDDMKISSWG